jgi:uncharacterized protein
MTSSIFPDLNVWLALNVEQHRDYEETSRWYESLDGTPLLFCRITQLGLLRLLTTPAVMGKEVLTNGEALRIYQAWILKGTAILFPDPATFDVEFAKFGNTPQSSPKLWADAYLSAFAVSGSLSLITRDRALAARTANSILLA